MKVGERKSVLDPRVGGAVGPAPAAGPPPAAASTGGDQVSVSETARELAHLRAEVGDVDTVAAEQVASLRAAAARGAYVPDVRGAAERLLREVLEELLA
jgi:flagellar biosynthesis anti-sigma factor FlgM